MSETWYSLRGLQERLQMANVRGDYLSLETDDQTEEDNVCISTILWF